MSVSASLLIDAYLDETISAQEFVVLEAWIAAAPANAGEFAHAVSLHDRLHGELLARAGNVIPVTSGNVSISPGTPGVRVPRWAAWTATALVAGVVCLALWNGLGTSTATAAVVELNRLIETNAVAADRTWKIAVESVAERRTRRVERSAAEERRPPKPPLDGAMLHVRHGGLFVLIRRTAGGLPFVTGSDGLASWAVKPDGSVRVSADLNEFNRDLPGHEESLPLINVDDGLARLRTAYDVQVVDASEAGWPITADRLLVGTKRRGFRGPEQVEIAYTEESGRILGIRFVAMPYGPDRLTIRLTLESESDLGPTFFGHAAHHAGDLNVEIEK